MFPVDLHEIRYLRPRTRKNPACDLPPASLSMIFLRARSSFTRLSLIS
ncbi:MAG: hypothetical protein JW841_02880 [Deltaproteobacteria bacterium]|nr:hypothetical protein [Deltaproteobacteria bacterium]